MKKTLFALALMAVVGLGGLVYESASAAQNTNSSTTSMGNMGPKPNMGGRRGHPRHGRRHGRRHRRGGRTGNKNKNM
jgi:hypothetical protein